MECYGTRWDRRKKLAFEAGDIDSDGTPMCPVVADGQWSKRNYKTKYDAFSGAVIFNCVIINKKLYTFLKNSSV